MKDNFYKALSLAILGVLIIALLVVGGFYFGKSKFGMKLFRGHDGEARLLFVGDMMFDRSIRTIGERSGYDSVFSCVADYMNDFDMVVGNLEGPITENPSVSRGTVPGQDGNTTFTFDPAVADALANAGFGIVSIGNNHIYDFGVTGAKSTVQALSDKGILSFGGFMDSNGSFLGDIATSTVIKGWKIAFINYNQFSGDSDPERTIQAIWRMRQSNDFVVVYAHWGNEYEAETENQKILAHRFIDAGANIVVGSHPHVIQATEIYEGKPIYYSLGNFIFDQYWNDEVSTGLGIELVIGGKEGLSIKENRFNISAKEGTCLHTPLE